MKTDARRRLNALRRIFRKMSRKSLRVSSSKKYVERCEDCKGPLVPSKKTPGMGSCETCGTHWAMPIGRVLSSGRHAGKYVYTRAGLMAELRETCGDYAGEELDVELRNARIVVIDLIQED